MNEKHFERKNELLEAAVNEFAVKSFEDASLNTIIKNAGISKGTFYYHFRDKEALYLFLLKSAAEAKWNYINTHIPVENFDKAGIFDNIKTQARLGVDFAAAYPQYHKLGIMFFKERGTPVFTAAVKFLGDSSNQKLDTMISQAFDNHEFNNSLTKEFIFKFLHYFLLGFDEIFTGDGDSDPENMYANIEMYINALQKGLGR